MDRSGDREWTPRRERRLYGEARARFTEKELVDVTFAVIAINARTRLAVTFRPAVGSDKPSAATEASR